MRKRKPVILPKDQYERLKSELKLELNKNPFRVDSSDDEVEAAKHLEALASGKEKCIMENLRPIGSIDHMQACPVFQQFMYEQFMCGLRVIVGTIDNVNEMEKRRMNDGHL